LLQNPSIAQFGNFIYLHDFKHIKCHLMLAQRLLL
jgi:hypothetical protein